METNSVVVVIFTISVSSLAISAVTDAGTVTCTVGASVGAMVIGVGIAVGAGVGVGVESPPVQGLSGWVWQEY